MEFFNFIFGTYAGIGCLVGAGLLISLILAFLLERKTRRIYKDRGPAAPGESFFDDDESDGEE